LNIPMKLHWDVPLTTEILTSNDNIDRSVPVGLGKNHEAFCNQGNT
jgi:hypothetical protein